MHDKIAVSQVCDKCQQRSLYAIRETRDEVV